MNAKDVMGMEKKLLLVGYPKSGNTWLGYMLSYLLNAEYIEPYNLTEGLCYTHDQRVLRLTSGNVDGQLRTGYSSVVKTHAYPPSKYQLSRFPRLTDKVVLIIRDPRDVAVSRYHYAKIHTENVRTGIGITKHVSFWRTMTSWKKHTTLWVREKPYVVKYEDLHARGHESLVALLSYLEVGIDHDLVDNAFSQFAIDRLKGKNKSTYGFRFFRKGTVADYKNHFTRVDFLSYKLICRNLARDFGYK